LHVFDLSSLHGSVLMFQIYGTSFNKLIDSSRFVLPKTMPSQHGCASHFADTNHVSFAGVGIGVTDAG
jgi:hypothetical protein